MGKTYDNWEKLVTSVLRRELYKQLALCPSLNSSTISSRSSSFSSVSNPQLHESLVNGVLRSQDLHTPSFTATYYDYDEDHHLDVFIDKKTGVKCFMVGARALLIASSDASQGWKWMPHSRFVEVVEFQSIWSLDVRCKIKIQMLPRRITYAAFLVFKLSENFKGLRSARAVIRFVEDESDRDAEKRARPIQLMKGKNGIVVERGDEWMEVEMGCFYVSQGDNGNVEVLLFEKSRNVVKMGLIIACVELRPIMTRRNTPLVSKHCLSKIVMT